MSPGDLEALFNALATPTAGSLSARPVAGGARYRVARQGDGAPALLILVDAIIAQPVPANEQLANLSYRPRERLRIESPDGTIEESIHSVLACRAAEPELRHYFFRVVAALLDELGPTPSAEDVDGGVAQLLELFRALERPGRRSVQGLWAELLLIAASSDPEVMVAAWHAEPEAIHDFVSGVQRLEVKSTAGALRRHHFRLEQVVPPAGSVLVVASLLLEPAEAGTTVADLVDRIAAALPTGTDLRRRLEAIVAAALGSDWRAGAAVSFDETAALRALAYFPSSSIPAVAPDTPAEVSDVHFISDLSGLSPVWHADLKAAGGLLGALPTNPP